MFKHSKLEVTHKNLLKPTFSKEGRDRMREKAFKKFNEGFNDFIKLLYRVDNKPWKQGGGKAFSNSENARLPIGYDPGETNAQRKAKEKEKEESHARN